MLESGIGETGNDITYPSEDSGMVMVVGRMTLNRMILALIVLLVVEVMILFLDVVAQSCHTEDVSIVTKQDVIDEDALRF